jgi:hypothetical protein
VEVTADAVADNNGQLVHDRCAALKAVPVTILQVAVRGRPREIGSLGRL